MQEKPILQFKEVSRSFGGVKAVNNLSFNVNKGEILGVIGPNGAGKSTTFDIITGLTKMNSGEIIFEGRDISRLKTYKINKLGIGRTFQKIKVFSELSVFDNVTIGALSHVQNINEAKENAKENLKFVGLYEQKLKLAKNLTLVDRKKLELARALCTNPKLILVDELMCGLNSQETEEGVNLLRQMNSLGTTIILVEHVMEVIVSLAKRIIVLNYGNKIGEGNPHEILQSPRVIEAYLGGGLQEC